MTKYVSTDTIVEKLWPVDPENDGSDGCTVVLQNLTFTSADLESLLDEIPAADVAPVVRCKECEFHTFLGKCKVHSQEPDQYGPGHDVTMAPDDFCSYGKRKQLEE